VHELLRTYIPAGTSNPRRLTWNEQPVSNFFFILLIFPALAALFLYKGFMDVRRGGFKITPAAKVWLRIGLIFAAVSTYLFLSQRHFP